MAPKKTIPLLALCFLAVALGALFWPAARTAATKRDVQKWGAAADTLVLRGNVDSTLLSTVSVSSAGLSSVEMSVTNRLKISEVASVIADKTLRRRVRHWQRGETLASKEYLVCDFISEGSSVGKVTIVARNFAFFDETQYVETPDDLLELVARKAGL